ncbi:MAG: divalent-cation tolerance protein CutA [Stenotrophobium sp.]
MSTPILLALVSCPPDTAEALAEMLVREHHAACVNIIPQLRSVYRWNDTLQKDSESLLLIKTAQTRYDALCAAILAHHPYELPEIIAVNPQQGHAPYLDWVLGATR